MSPLSAGPRGPGAPAPPPPPKMAMSALKTFFAHYVILRHYTVMHDRKTHNIDCSRPKLPR